jgi:hypothetical protein
MKALIQETKNYGRFDFDVENRDFDPGKHRDLFKKLQAHGFDPARPIVCTRGKNGRLVVVDGQHRLNFCRDLQIPVYFTITEHADPREFNSSSIGWSIADWVKSWRCSGNEHYETLANFVEKYKLPITTSANILAGIDNGSGGGIVKKIKSGKFEVSDIGFANASASAIVSIADHFKEARSFYFVAAVSKCVRVKEFKLDHLIRKITKFPGLLKPCARIDQYLEDIQALYNYADKKGQIPLKFLANQMSKTAAK